MRTIYIGATEIVPMSDWSAFPYNLANPIIGKLQNSNIDHFEIILEYPTPGKWRVLDATNARGVSIHKYKKSFKPNKVWKFEISDSQYNDLLEAASDAAAVKILPNRYMILAGLAMALGIEKRDYCTYTNFPLLGKIDKRYWACGATILNLLKLGPKGRHANNCPNNECKPAAIATFPYIEEFLNANYETITVDQFLYETGIEDKGAK